MKTKKAIALILALLTVVSAIPMMGVSVSADFTVIGDVCFYYDVVDDEIVISISEGNPTVLEIPETINGYPVTSIKDYGFQGCTAIESVHIPKTVTKIGEDAFINSENLDTVYYGGTIEQWNSVSIGISNECLRNATTVCSDGVVVAVPEGLEYYVDEGSVIISGYTGTATTLEIPATIEGYPVIGIREQSFYSITSLENVIISEGMIYIDQSAFSGCSNLESITIPETMGWIGGASFEGCTSLKAVYYAGTAEQWNEIAILWKGNELLQQAELICAKIFVPEGLSYEITDGEAIIKGYEGSEINFEIPAIIGSYPVTGISDYAFDNRPDLKSITFPESLTSIGEYAFNSCRSLETVYYKGTKAQWYAITIADGNDTLFVKAVICNDGEIPAIPDGLDINIHDGEVIITDYTGSAKNLELPSMIGIYPVTTIGAYAFSECSSLQGISLPEGLTAIEQGAFSGCSALRSINIPAGVISMGQSAFSGCAGLESIMLPEGLMRIEESVFNGCTGLKKLSIPGGVISIGGRAFYGCTKLESIIIPDGVVSIEEYTFFNCSALKSITIPGGIVAIGDSAFYGCSSLEAVYYGATKAEWYAIHTDSNNDDLFYAAVVFIDGETEFIPEGLAFNIFDGEAAIVGYKGSAAILEIPALIGRYPVTSIGDHGFYSCTGLESIILPEGLTDIGYGAFEGCSFLKSITLPSDVKTIGESAFYGCSRLDTVYFDGTKEQWDAISIGYGNDELRYAIIICSDGEIVPIPDGLSYSISNDEVTITDYMGSSPVLVIPATINGYPVTTIDWYVFYNNIALTTITLPASLISIGDSAFYDCPALETVYYGGTIAQWNAINTESGNDALSSARVICSDGAIAPVPKGLRYEIIDGKVTIIEYAGGEAVLEIPATIKGYPVTTIGDYAFVNSYCANLESVIIPDGVVNIADGAFFDCYSLSSITLPEGLESIGVFSFRGCSSLKNITIPKSVTNISMYAFYECTSLESIIIPKGVTVLDECLFYGCISLESITLPAGIQIIGEAVFEGCSALDTVNYGGSEEQWNEIDKSYCMELEAANIVFNYGNEIIVGDINGDGMISALDANILRRITSGAVDVEDWETILNVADINGDGLVSIADSNLIKRILAGVYDIVSRA